MYRAYSKFDYYELIFISLSGAPTHLYPGRDPDWAPSLNLGHNKFGSEIGSADRYLRRCYRQMKKNVKNPVQSDEEGNEVITCILENTAYIISQILIQIIY